MKKSVHHKKTNKKKLTPKVSSISFYRVAIIVTSIFIIVGLFSFILQRTSPTNTCANSLSCIKDLSVRVENDATGVFEGQKVVPPKIDLAQDFLQRPVVLGAEFPSGPKHIYIDLTTQTLSAYQGEKLVLKTFVSTGRWGRTPTGEFTIWVKLRATRMAGGQGTDYYNLPNVPYVMFFYNKEVNQAKGFSLHGAYWHNNFGYPMSHGCVNMRIVDSQALYNWADPTTTSNTTHATKDNPGTSITIFGQTLI